MFEKFFTDKFDDEFFLVRNGEKMTFANVKELVVKKAETLDKTKQVLIFGEDNFDFIISFFAAVFSRKEIFLADKNVPFNLEKTYDDSVFAFEQINLKNVFINFLTSGSSGNSKIVKKSLFNLVREAEDIGKTFLSGEKDFRFCSTTTLNHLFGFTFHFMTPFVNEFVIDTNSFQYPENVKHDNCFLVSSPSFLEKIYKYNLNFEKSPKFIVAAGAKLADDVFEYFEKNSKVIEIYGSTETGVVAHREHFEQKYLTLFENISIQKYENKILRISSDYFYEKSLELSDLIDCNGKNEITVLGRLDRVLKISEKRISADVFEKYLKTCDFISDIYCLKIDEKLGAAVVLTDKGKDFYLKFGKAELVKNLKTVCLEKFEIVPQKWRFLPEIYKTSAGKVDKKKIEKIFLTKLTFPFVLGQKIEGDVAEIDMIFPKNSNFFKGHFPHFPVLPGVVSLYFVTFFANEFFKTSMSPQVIRKIKFSKLILPDKNVTLRLKNSEKSVAFEIVSGQNNYVSGVISKEKIYE